MPDYLTSFFLLFCLLQIKHMFADFFFQSRWMLAGRREYVHAGRAVHAAIHSIGSAIALLIVGVDLGFVLILVLAEWVVHFHIDWGKAAYSDARGLQPDQPRFWQAAGVDQALHQFTYLAMVWLVARHWIA